MTEKKIDQILKEIGSLKEGQQKNYGLIQKNGVKLEQVASDLKGAAEGHAAIRREMQEMKNELKSDIKEVDDKLKFVAKQLGDKIDKMDNKLDEHLKVPHSVG